MAPGRLFKAFTSEGGIRSPLIVKGAGRNPEAGGMNGEFLHVRDIMPTLLEVAGAAHSEEFRGRAVRPMQGRSVLDLFEGKALAPYSEAGKVGYELFGLRAFFDGDWKVLWMPKPFGKGDWELFNVRNDPGELKDLSDENPEKRKEMIALWEQYTEENGVLDTSMDLSGE